MKNNRAIPELEQSPDPGSPVKAAPEDPKVIDEREIAELLENLPNFELGSISKIEPENWKIVGVSLIHSNNLLRDHCIAQKENLNQMNEFLKRFASRVITNQKFSEMEHQILKTKMTEDVATANRSAEDGLKNTISVKHRYETTNVGK
jgi:hypothetical protein